MTPRQARIGVDLFTALVVASVGVAAAGLTWRLLGDPGTRYGAAPVVAPREPVDVEAIIAAQPFGSARAGALPASDQPLTLRGIVLASPRAASTVLVQVGEAPVAAYRLGESVGAATIEAIERDHIVLAVNGRRQVLAFPEPAGGSAPPPSPPPQVAPAGPASAGAFLQGLGIAETGAGFVVGDAPVGRLAGLQRGDRIERVNGQNVGELARDPGGLAKLSAGGAVRIELVRGGQRLTLVVPLG